MQPLSDAYDADMDACRTRLRGGSRSFHAAAKLLPRAVRDPAVALYAFCRDADDIIDGGTSPDDDGDTGRVEWLRERLSLIYAGRPFGCPADRAFARIVERFAIPRALPEALLEGFAWDAQGSRFQDLPALRAYAVRVAGSVGAMMAVVMGVRDAERLAAAVDLGVAMQLSNIARDVGEDARNGRLYLPLAWLGEAGIEPDAFLADPVYSPALGRVIGRLLDAAEQLYDRAGAGVARLPLGCRFGIGAAALLYAEIGHEVSRRGMDSVSGRAVVSARRKASVMVSQLGGMLLPLRPLHSRCLPEGEFLLDAVARTAPHREPALVPWWDMVERLRWTIDLFARLEQRERVQP